MSRRIIIDPNLFRALWMRRDLTVEHIGQVMCMSSSKVRDVAVDLMLPRRVSGRPPAPPTDESARNLFATLYQSTLRVTDIADLLAVSASTVSRMADRCGVPKRRTRGGKL